MPDCPMILAGLNEERVRKIGFYLRHDPNLTRLYFRTLRTCNILADMITTEMTSIIQDEVYWNRIGTASSFEIYRIRLLMHGPSNFFKVLYGTLTNRVLENTGNEADEIEHHLSVLRAKMNDLSCLLASINDAAGYLKRSYLVSNNRHYLYLICDTSKDSLAYQARAAETADAGDLSVYIDGAGARSAAEVLAPLRQMCREDINGCLDSLLRMLERFDSKAFTPPNIPTVSPRITTAIPPPLKRRASISAGHIAGDEHLSPRMLRRKSLSSIHSSPIGHGHGPQGQGVWSVPPSPARGAGQPLWQSGGGMRPAPGGVHHSTDSAPGGRTVPPLGSGGLPAGIEENDDDGLGASAEVTEDAMNEKLVTILKVFNEIGPNDKTGHYPMGFSAAPLRRPSNFDMYWIPSLMLCSVAGIGVFYVIQAFQSGELQELLAYSVQSSIIKFKEHIVEPLDKLAHELFDSKFKEGIIVTKEDLEQSYIALSRMLDDYYDNVVHHEEPDRADRLQALVDEAKTAFLLRARDATSSTADAAAAYADGTKDSMSQLANFSDSKIVQTIDQFSSYLGGLIKRGDKELAIAASANNAASSAVAGGDPTAASDAQLVPKESWWSSLIPGSSAKSKQETFATEPVTVPTEPTAAVDNTTTTATTTSATATATATPAAGGGEGPKSLPQFDLSSVGAQVKAPSPITTRTTGVTTGTSASGDSGSAVGSGGGGKGDTYMYKKLTALDIVEMQTKSSLVMDELMKDYEEELKSPIRGMITGNLMRSMLIQLQKLKVHTEAAMLTMDQILASNELTIAATAALPAVMLMSVGWKLLRRAFTSKAPKPGEQTLSVRLAMVEVERSLQNVYCSSRAECDDADGDGGGSCASATHTLTDAGVNDMELDGSFMHTTVGRWNAAVPPSSSQGKGSGKTDGSSCNSRGGVRVRGLTHPVTTSNASHVSSTIFEDEDDNVSISTDPGETLPGADPAFPAEQAENDGGGVVPDAEVEVDAEKVPHPTTLRAKGMLVFRIVTLHKALVALFLVQRPIVNVLLGGWTYIMHTLRVIFSRSSTVGNMRQLLSWVQKDMLESRAGEPVSSVFNRDRNNNLTAVTLRVSGGGNTEYRNLHRDLLELSAPFYEINGARKLATAARMRASYQCLAPPSY